MQTVNTILVPLLVACVVCLFKVVNNDTNNNSSRSVIATMPRETNMEKYSR